MRDRPIKFLEGLLIDFDSGPWGALFRVGIGLVIPPIFSALAGGHNSVWSFLAFFIGLLIMLRVVPVVVRLALPFSAEVKELWAERRALAKRYDSYQWRKLFWIGLGLLPHAVIAGKRLSGELVVAVICLVGGGLGLVIWRKLDPMRSAR